ncbi:hypothetical protein ACEPAH_2494 [Sanghuangporus vaninii]
MSSGLRKRLAVFKKPLTSSPVSDIRVLHAEDERRDGEEEEEDHEHVFVKEVDDALSESLSRSFSSISEHSSGSGDAEDDSEHEHEHDRGTEAPNANGPTSIQQEQPPKNPTQSPKFEATRSSSRGPSKSLPSAIRRGTNSLRPVQRTRSGSSSASSSGSWLGYDLSIIVALVSPIGNILTGNDHIRNILLLLFLIYYLHQLVEVPWNLYLASIPSENLFSPSEVTDPAKLAAYAELRSLEIFYLVLTVVSPFLGGSLLKYVATAISGDPASLSWFSTSLFVLATGIRPWSHLAERLKNRSRALKALVEQQDLDGQPDDEEDPKVEIDREISDLRGKFDLVDKRLTDLDVSSSREWDDLADAIDAIELGVRKYQSESNKKAKEWDARIGVLETYVLDLHSKDRKTRIHEKETYLRGVKLRAVFWDVLALPWTVSALTWDATRSVARQLGLSMERSVSATEKGKISPTTPTPSHGKFRSHTLETIVEEDQESQDQDKEDAAVNDRYGCVGSDSSHTLVAEAAAISATKDRADIDVLDLVSTLALRLLHFAFSPLIFLNHVLSTLLELPRSVFHAIIH